MISKGEVHVFLRGGLGNQLFQYSSGLSFSREHGTKLVLRPDLLPRIEDKIGGVSRWPNQISSFRHSGEVRNGRYQPPNATNMFGKAMQLMRMSADLAPTLTRQLGWLAAETSELNPEKSEGIRLLNGYCQFKPLVWKVKGQVASEVKSIVNPSAMYERLKSDILEESPTVVHLRRGDYVGLGRMYGELPAEYFKSAMQLLGPKGRDAPLWLFTDDAQAVDEVVIRELSPTRVLEPTNTLTPLETLSLMSNGRSFIGSNSSFSWWATFLMDPAARAIVPNMKHAKVNNFVVGGEPNAALEFIDVI